MKNEAFVASLCIMLVMVSFILVRMPVEGSTTAQTILSLNGAVANPQQPYSYIIYINGTNYFMENGTTGQIDYYSTNASQVINNAYGNLTNGGLIDVEPGTYFIDNIRVTQSATSLVGLGSQLEWQPSGWGVVFQPTANTQSAMITFAGVNNTVAVFSATVADITFYDPTNTFNVSAIKATYTDNLIIKECNFKSLRGGAIKILDGVYTGAIRDCDTYSCGSTNYPTINFNGTGGPDETMGIAIDHFLSEYCFGDVIYMKNTAQNEICGLSYFEENGSCPNVIYADTGSNFIDIHDSHFLANTTASTITVNTESKVHDNDILSGSLVGVNCTGDLDTVSDNTIQYPNWMTGWSSLPLGIGVFSSTDSIITGNILSQLRSGIELANSNNITVTENDIEYSSANYGISISNTYNSHITGNTLNPAGTSAIKRISGSNNLISNNAGFVTESSGSQANCISGTAITHGLAGTPNGYITAFTNITGEVVSITAVSSTTFTLGIEWINGTAVDPSHSPCTVYWSAQYQP